MDAGAIIEARLMALEGVLQIVAILLTLVSAYLTGLYFFLARATAFLRFVAFFGMSAGFFFLAVNAISLIAVYDALERCEGCAEADVTGYVQLPIFGAVAADGVYALGAISGFVLGGFIYLMLCFLTVFTGWARRDRGLLDRD